MYLAENVPVAICTPRTLTVRAKPVSATIAPTIVASTVVAVEAEYVQYDGHVDGAVEQTPGIAEDGPEDPAEERQRPEAPLQVLAQAEGGAPGHRVLRADAARQVREELEHQAPLHRAGAPAASSVPDEASPSVASAPFVPSG